MPDDMFTRVLQVFNPESRCPLGYGDAADTATPNPHTTPNKQPPLPPNQQKSETSLPKITLYHNCKVYTGERDQLSEAEAFAVLKNKFIAVGSLDHVQSSIPRGSEATMVDLNGAFVTPGLIDSHLHLISGGLSLNRLDLRHITEKQHFIDAVHAAVDQAHPGDWIQGANWDESKWGGEAPSAAWINEISPLNPVFLTRMDAHQAVVNDLAMTLANLTVSTPDPPGGVITHDPVTKQPTGLLSDAAMLLVAAAIPAKTVEHRQTGFLTAQEHLLSLGITSVHDMGRIAFLEGDDAAWEDLEEVYLPAANNNALKIRINAFVPLKTWRRMAERVKHVGTRHPGGKLQWGGVKEFYDGSLGSRTALMHEPYNDVAVINNEEAEEQSMVGTRTVDITEFQKQIEGAHKAGLQIAVHAIGDQAVDEVLDAYELLLKLSKKEKQEESNDEKKESGGDENAVNKKEIEDINRSTSSIRQRRHRIEHAQHTKNSDKVRARMSKLGIVTTPNPLHLLADGGILESRLGKERVDHGAYAFKTLCSIPSTSNSPSSAEGGKNESENSVSTKERIKIGDGGGDTDDNADDDDDLSRAPPVCAFASDWPVVQLNPALTLRAASVYDREESVSSHEAFLGLTSGAAFVGHREKEIGRIAPGLLADFVVFDSDILDYRVGYAHVRETYVDGVCVYGCQDEKIEVVVGGVAGGGDGGHAEDEGGSIADALKAGNYKITYRGPGPCKGRILSYQRHGKEYPAKISLGAETTKNPVVWQVTKLGLGEITLQAINRASCCPAKISYKSSSCSSKTAQLDKSGTFKFKLTTIDKLKSLYRLDASSRRTCSAKGYGRLGPIASSTARRCDQSSNNGIQLNLMNSASQNMQWKFTLISLPSPPPSPPSLPSPSPISPLFTFPPPPPPPPPPAVGPVRPNNFCSFPTTRSIISGRRIKSTLSGIRPCYGPRVANSGECCSQCQADPTCIAWTFTKPMDCRGQGIPDVASTGACYLIEEETGSYEPLLSFDYVSGRAFSKRSH